MKHRGERSTLLWAAVAVLLLLVAVPGACGQTYTSVMDALDNLKSAQQLGAFADMVAAAGKADDLSKPNLQAYVFVATDDAMSAESFTNYFNPTRQSDAVKVVNYHVVPVDSGDAAPPPLAWAKATLATLLPASSTQTGNITVSPTTEQNKVIISSIGSGSTVDVTDSIVAGKSRIYILTDAPLIVPSVDTATTLVPYNYLTRHASQDMSPFTIADFMLLVNTSAEVSEILSSATYAATVFIPSDEAFKATWDGNMPPIGEIAGSDAATELLKQHIVPQPLDLGNEAAVKCVIENPAIYTWNLKNLAGDDVTLALACPGRVFTVTTQTSKGITSADVPSGSYIGGMSTFVPINNVLMPGAEINFPPGLVIDNFIPPPPPPRPSIPASPPSPLEPPSPSPPSPSPPSPSPPSSPPPPPPSPVKSSPPPSPTPSPSLSPSPAVVPTFAPPPPPPPPSRLGSSPPPASNPSPPPAPSPAVALTPPAPPPAPLEPLPGSVPSPSPPASTPTTFVAPSPPPTRSGDTNNIQVGNNTAPPPAPGAATRAAASTPLMVLSALLGALMMLVMAAGTSCM